MRHICNTVILLLALACSQCSTGNEGVDVGNPTIPTLTISNLSFTATATETGNCRLTAIAANAPEYVHAGSANLLATLSSDIDLTDEGYDDAIDYELRLFEGDVEIDLFTDADNPVFVITTYVPENLTELEINVQGLPNPAVSASSSLIIPAGVLTCADQSQNTSGYQIDFTLVHNDDCAGSYCNSFLTWDETYDVVGTPAASCEIQAIADMEAVGDYIDDTILSIRTLLYFSDPSLDPDAAASDGELVNSIDDNKIQIVRGEQTLTLTTQDAPGHSKPGYNIFDLRLDPADDLSNGDYTLRFLPGAFGCLDGSSNEASYEMAFTIENLDE